MIIWSISFSITSEGQIHVHFAYNILLEKKQSGVVFKSMGFGAKLPDFPTVSYLTSVSMLLSKYGDSNNIYFVRSTEE